MSAIPKDRKVPADWRIVRVEMQGMVGPTWLAERQITKCGVYYLVDVSQHVHICSLTPSLEAWAVQGFAEFATPEAWEKDQGETEMEMLSSEEHDVSYFSTDLCDRNTWKPAALYLDIPEPEDEETWIDYNRRVFEEMREVLCGNPVSF